MRRDHKGQRPGQGGASRRPGHGSGGGAGKNREQRHSDGGKAQSAGPSGKGRFSPRPPKPFGAKPYSGRPAGPRPSQDGDRRGNDQRGGDEARAERRPFRGPGKPYGTGGRPGGFFKSDKPYAAKGGRRPPERDDGVIRDDPLRRGKRKDFKGPGKGTGSKHGSGRDFARDARAEQHDRGGTSEGKRFGGRGDKSSGKTGGPPRGDKWRERGPRHEDRARERKSGTWHPGQKDQPKSAAAGAPAGPMRIAKAIARAGLCSRREAERWIEEGRVSVNGKVLGSPAVEVGPRDKIVVDGQPLPEAEGVRLWRYHKPRGLVTTHSDPEGRPTVFDSLPRDLPRVISIGRLDFNTEGLLLLTNDGELARHLELPATGWLRRYRVRARGRVTQAQLDALKEGVSVEGVNYGPVEASLDSEQGANIWLTIGLREGKNREIRKILASLGLEVSRLIRVSFGPFQLLDLEPGGVDRIRRRTLREQLGPKIARELGLIEGTEAPDAPPRDRPRKPRHNDAPQVRSSSDDDFDFEVPENKE